MGIWGTAIASNDIYRNITGQFFTMYNRGMEVSEIKNNLVTEYLDIAESEEHRNNFWLALAAALWECKSLDPQTLIKIKVLIQTDSDLRLWKELGATPEEISLRRARLNSFLAKISAEKTFPRKRKLPKLRDAIFEKGDCLTVKLENGYYGAAFVLESEKSTETGLNLIAGLNYYSPEKPTQDYFKKAHILMYDNVAYDYVINT